MRKRSKEDAVSLFRHHPFHLSFCGHGRIHSVSVLGIHLVQDRGYPRRPDRRGHDVGALRCLAWDLVKETVVVTCRKQDPENVHSRSLLPTGNDDWEYLLWCDDQWFGTDDLDQFHIEDEFLTRQRVVGIHDDELLADLQHDHRHRLPVLIAQAQLHARFQFHI